MRAICYAMCTLVLTASIGVPAARAGSWNEATELTFPQAVEIPGRVLPAGTYLFVLANNDFDRQIVQVFSSDRSSLYATVQAVTVERLQPASETVLTFAERPSDQPEAILTWFYPGESIGHGFVYPRNEERELTADKHDTLAVVYKDIGLR